jgi:hypothetical protein
MTRRAVAGSGFIAGSPALLKDPSLKRKPTDAVPVYTSLIAKRGVPSSYKLVRKPAAADCTLVPAADRSACTDAAGS